MRAIQLRLSGNWAHFKKPETNNNPLTHDLIPKTALLGLIGAVLGIERLEMKSLFPQFSEDFRYGVQLLKPLRKESWGFTSRKAINPTAAGSPKYFEFLRNPDFKVTLALRKERSQRYFSQFLQSVREETSVYTPVLGWHNCPAEVQFVSDGNIAGSEEGEFETQGFVTSDQHTLKNTDAEFRIGLDKLPTYQDDDFWNWPERYQLIMYPDCEQSLRVKGTYYTYITSQHAESWYLM